MLESGFEFIDSYADLKPQDPKDHQKPNNWAMYHLHTAKE